ncbi:unnamed protein product [Protopolystoma xenopodis]|uniref:Uncharacterized protein n=1 Tax=Protopolystoma xenopodis TaxID=117903 RepID=A0A448WKN5_9PLAT|nr:unnamed protein product [Protopolystoma xenopodis]
MSELLRQNRLAQRQRQLQRWDKCGTADRCQPHIAYAMQSVVYFSSLEQVALLRRHLSLRWEPILCRRLDQLIPRLRTEMAITANLTQIGCHRFSAQLSASFINDAYLPQPVPMLLIEAEYSKSELEKLVDKTRNYRSRGSDNSANLKACSDSESKISPKCMFHTSSSRKLFCKVVRNRRA